ncbi:MAG: sensor histidine kinase [Weeksellaceae bacterium]
MLERLRKYLSPIAQLGETHYSTVFPLVGTLFFCVLLEIYAFMIARDPDAVGLLAIFVFVALIIYFAFRDGRKGGFIATAITIGYYFYIIRSRAYQGQQLVEGVETTVILGFLYLFLAVVIGWLKETIDQLIERESDEKRRLQNVIEQLPVGIIITDANGVIVQANNKINHILGMDVPIGFQVGKENFIVSKLRNKLTTPSQSPLAQTLVSGKPIVGKEFTVIRPDKKEVVVRVSASAIQNRTGKIIAAASIISDITQQKELEERKDDFINMASHELKTPITSMNLYVDVLTKYLHKYKDEKSESMLVNIKRQTGKLQKIISDLLDVSRIQTGKLTYTKEEFRLDKLVEEIIETLQDATKGQTISLRKKTPIIVYADRFRIYQVVTNMITNAIKYSPETKEIVVEVKRLDGKAQVSVKDTGIGIARDQQKRIFERLYQVGDTHVKTFPGFGMGLHISNEIIKRHKGAIWVESEKGKGSTFYFTLPLAKK